MTTGLAAYLSPHPKDLEAHSLYYYTRWLNGHSVCYNMTFTPSACTTSLYMPSYKHSAEHGAERWLKGKKHAWRFAEIWVTSNCSSSCRGSDTLFWSPQVPTLRWYINTPLGIYRYA